MKIPATRKKLNPERVQYLVESDGQVRTFERKSASALVDGQGRLVELMDWREFRRRVNEGQIPQGHRHTIIRTLVPVELVAG